MVKRLRCCSSSRLPETIWDYEDIFSEILVRVPARILLRFKCVSKHWLSFISDPKFCHRHTLRNPNPSASAVFCNLSRSIGFIPLDFDHYRTTSTGSGSPSCNPLKFIANLCHDNIKIIQSCNGLFLCYPEIVLNSIIHDSDVLRATRPLYHYVLNPTTNQFSKLIPPAAAAATTTRPRIFGYALAFDPSKSPHYKVVFLWNVDDSSSTGWCSYHHIEIYSSETKSWRLLNSSFETQGQISYKGGVYCNSTVHWVGDDSEMAYYHIEEDRVGFVDGFPYSEEKNWETREHRYFKESSDGHLHLIDIYWPCSTKFEVLEMGRDYSGWFVKYTVDLDPLFTAYPWIQAFVVLFLAKGQNEEEGSSLLLHDCGKVLSYNLKSHTFKSIDLTPQAGVDDTSSLRVGQSNHRYMETLACV
ncbi:PREDICTED: F-box protein At5g07610-like [Fragaria vesca subsp. vesca]|uniref:F-box protein At5g07610-like n=1 Tax=Fragaria vesca subsp. vesca TaxID=101020 RepID=UPI0002C2E67C|nr:PREDICTED: F-box protein At5g07610-like [Fragaria vesca subsp. vesca]